YLQCRSRIPRRSAHCDRLTHWWAAESYPLSTARYSEERNPPMSKDHGSADARERLAQAVERMADSETFGAWLRARATFHDYSFANVCLIVSQRPDATRVAGYKTWQKLGRQVRNGEHGIRILAPCRIKAD